MYARLVFGFSIHRNHIEKILPHTHNCHELVFYSGGSKGITEYGGKKYDFSDNGIAVIKKGTPHSEEHFCGSDVYCLGFDTDYEIENLYVSEIDFLKDNFIQILGEVHEQDYGFERVVSCRLEEILVKIARKAELGRNAIKTLDHCKQYIKENCMQNVKIADVAAIIGYSPDHFRHLFKSTYGMSPQKYLIQTRLNYARDAILSTDASFGEIAEYSGFSNLSQFSRMIKNRYGKTPSQLRDGREFGV